MNDNELGLDLCSLGLRYTNGSNKSKLEASKANTSNMNPCVDEYDFTHARRGIAIIIMNDSCEGEKERQGSFRDMQHLQNMFAHLDFEIKCLVNKKKVELLNELKRIQKEDFSAYDCVAMAISSHGLEKTSSTSREDYIQTFDGNFVKTRAILKLFTDQNCPSLVGKPRFVFIQACRGDQKDDGQEILVKPQSPMGDGFDEVDGSQSSRLALTMIMAQETQFSRRPSNDELGSKPMRVVKISPAPCFNDFLVMYGAPAGYYVFRNQEKGSWFLNYLNQVLTDDRYSSLSLLQQLTKVSSLLAQDFESCSPSKPEFHQKKQIPVIYSKLQRDVFFSKKF